MVDTHAVNLRKLIDGKHGESALEIGKAAEYLACADLILSGYRAFLSDQGLPYDIVVDVGGKMLRIQVKACCFSKNCNAAGRAQRIAYTYNIRRRGKKGKGRLLASDVDIVACVALDIKQVAYFPLSEVGQTLQLHPEGFKFEGRLVRKRRLSIAEFPFSYAMDRLQGVASFPTDNDPGLIEIDGEKKRAPQWAEVSGTPAHLIHMRLSMGWDARRAVFDPLHPKKSDSKNEYKGVNKKSGKYRATLCVKRVFYKGPKRDTAIEAAYDYDELALKYRGPSATTNARLGLIRAPREGHASCHSAISTECVLT